VARLDLFTEAYPSPGYERLRARLRHFMAHFEERFDRFETRFLRLMLVLWLVFMGTVVALVKL
jgi:hypothetical protein